MTQVVAGIHSTQSEARNTALYSSLRSIATCRVLGAMSHPTIPNDVEGLVGRWFETSVGPRSLPETIERGGVTCVGLLAKPRLRCLRGTYKIEGIAEQSLSKGLSFVFWFRFHQFQVKSDYEKLTNQKGPKIEPWGTSYLIKFCLLYYIFLLSSTCLDGVRMSLTAPCWPAPGSTGGAAAAPHTRLSTAAPSETTAPPTVHTVTGAFHVKTSSVVL